MIALGVYPPPRVGFCGFTAPRYSPETNLPSVRAGPNLKIADLGRSAPADVEAALRRHLVWRGKLAATETVGDYLHRVPAKGHGFIRGMRCGTNSFLVAFGPGLMPQRLKPVKGGLSRVVVARLKSCPFASRATQHRMLDGPGKHGGLAV